nr:hypothetical protein [uncultured Halomonas sp.]
MRATLKQHQAWIYLIAILIGMAIGWGSLETTQRWETWLWALLGVLLFLSACHDAGRIATPLLCTRMTGRC